MRGTWRLLLIVVVALLVPVLPFFAFGESLAAAISSWLDPPPPKPIVALVTVGVLAVDVFLPVPSSVVSTFAGSQLGAVAATAASWLGMMLGAVVAFGLSKAFGRPLAVRLSSDDDIARMDRLGARWGVWLLIITRALPILAEAAVLILGTTTLGWRPFLIAVSASNLGIAVVYSALGEVAGSYGEMPLALAASIALPLLATIAARLLLGKPADEERPPITDSLHSNGSNS
jgi:uncharacterized membrane protein YdjX (TVP38/TMEM64 family)